MVVRRSGPASERSSHQAKGNPGDLSGSDRSPMRLSVRALLAGPCPVTEQAKYLLRAPARDMERWKARAEQRGRPFSEHIRASLDLIDRCPTSLLHQLLGDPPVEAAAAAVEGPAGAAASTGDLAAEPAVPPGAGSSSPVASSEGEAGLVQTPARPAAPPEPVIGRADLIDEARRLAGRMRR